MRKLVFWWFLVLASCLLFAGGVNASWLSESPLLTLNGQEYSKQDFRNWWKHWNDKGNLKLPESLNDYIDFKIMVQQALAMELNNSPDYLRKINVYLKVRSLMLLQYEDVDSQIEITEQDIRQSFDKRFSPVWDLQILTFNDRETADSAYLKMQPFAGMAAGRLVFADLQGVEGALYDEAKVSPEEIIKAKREEWLESIRVLKENYVSQPQSVGNHGQFVVIRVHGIMEPQEETFEKKKSRVKNDLRKKLKGKMTVELLKRLKKKFHLKVDEKLVNEIDIEQEYPDDFLEQTIVRMDGMEVSVAQFIMNVRRDKMKRPGAGQDYLKKNIINNIVSQSLIDREAKDRHYERTDLLKDTWAFYTENRLRITMGNRLKKKIEINDQEIVDYYKKNQKLFSATAQIIYDLLKGDQATVQKIWAGQLQGLDFMESARKHGVEPELVTASEGDLDDVLRIIVTATKRGETSAPFQYQGGEAIVRVQARIPATKKDLKSVQDEIRNKIIKARFKKEKEDYIKELRERSEIKVDDRVWEKIIEKSN